MNLELTHNIFRIALYLGTFLVAVGTIGVSIYSSKLDSEKATKIDKLLTGNKNLNSKIDKYQKDEELNKTKVLEVVAPKVNSILKYFEEQYSIMAIAAKMIELGDVANPSDEQIKEVLSKLNPKASSIMASVQEKRKLNWLEFMNQYNQRTILLIDEIYKIMPFLDTELISLLGELQNCYHFKEIQLVAHTDFVKNENLSFVPFTEYRNKINPIRKYYNENLEGFGINKPGMAIIPMIPEDYKEAEE
mgnify:CR=1 FL=1|jgi:hypothetical protein